jgi:hypothetical protein
MDWIDLIQGRTNWRAGSCEHGKEPPVYIKCGEFLDKLWNCYPLKKVSAPWIWPIQTGSESGEQEQIQIAAS